MAKRQGTGGPGFKSSSDYQLHSVVKRQIRVQHMEF